MERPTDSKEEDVLSTISDEFHMDETEQFVFRKLVELGSVDLKSDTWWAFKQLVGEEKSNKFEGAIKRLVELGYAYEEKQ